MSEVTYSTIKEGETGKLLTLDDLQKIMHEFRAKHDKPLKAIRISDETMRLIEQMLPTYPFNDRVSTLYSVPIEVDNDLGLFECKPVYA